VDVQFSGGPNLISVVLLQDRKDEGFLELTHRLRVLKAALIHVQYEIFELNLPRLSSATTIQRFVDLTIL